jgi:UDP-N-acetylglucosamine acyltransferase
LKIHSTAIIHPEAQLGPGVEIGSYVCVEGPAKIGARCVIQAHAILTGDVEIGEANTIGYGAIIGAAPQDLSFRPDTQSRVRIGDGNTIRELCTIHRGTAPDSETVVGNDNFLMAGVHLAHNTRIGNNVIIANNALLAGYVSVDDRAFIGGGSVFHQNIRIGRVAMIQGSSAIGKDVPPFTIGFGVNGIAGLNIVGLRRAGLTASQRSELRDAFRLLFESGLNTSQALEKSRERSWNPEAEQFWTFVGEARKRGICGRISRRATVEPAPELP